MLTGCWSLSVSLLKLVSGFTITGRGRATTKKKKRMGNEMLARFINEPGVARLTANRKNPPRDLCRTIRGLSLSDCRTDGAAWKHSFYFLNLTTWPQRRKHISKCKDQKTCQRQRWRKQQTGGFPKLRLVFVFFVVFFSRPFLIQNCMFHIVPRVSCSSKVDSRIQSNFEETEEARKS